VKIVGPQCMAGGKALTQQHGKTTTLLQPPPPSPNPYHVSFML
jgi:hypothetical protein